jgi:hypothetical protein
MRGQGGLGPDGEPPKERIYPPVGSLAMDRLFDVLDAEATTFRQVESRLPAGVLRHPPILRAQVPDLPEVGAGYAGPPLDEAGGPPAPLGVDGLAPA